MCEILVRWDASSQFGLPLMFYMCVLELDFRISYKRPSAFSLNSYLELRDQRVRDPKRLKEDLIPGFLNRLLRSRKFG